MIRKQPAWGHSRAENYVQIMTYIWVSNDNGLDLASLLMLKAGSAHTVLTWQPGDMGCAWLAEGPRSQK